MRGRAVVVACLVLGSLGVPQGARAVHEYDTHPTPLRFDAPVPCSVVCPYWTDTDDATCRPDPPSIPGSWDDHDLLLDPPPTTQRIVFLVLSITPVGESDSWICRQFPDEAGGYHLVTGANGECGDGVAYLLYCDESPELTVCTTLHWPGPGDGTCIPAGTPIRLRVYNWLDPTGSVDGEYYYSRTGKL